MENDIEGLTKCYVSEEKNIVKRRRSIMPNEREREREKKKIDLGWFRSDENMNEQSIWHQLFIFFYVFGCKFNHFVCSSDNNDDLWDKCQRIIMILCRWEKRWMFLTFIIRLLETRSFSGECLSKLFNLKKKSSNSTKVQTTGELQ